MTAMDMRMFDNAIARWVVQDPVIHHFQSPYNGFDGNPVYWADPSGADADNFRNNFDSYGRNKFDDGGMYIAPPNRGGASPEILEMLAAIDRASGGGSGKVVSSDDTGSWIRHKVGNESRVIYDFDGNFQTLAEVVLMPVYSYEFVSLLGDINTNIGFAGITYGILENSIANKYWWMDSKGNFRSTNLLKKGSNGKYVRGVQGFRNGYKSALGYAKGAKIAGTTLGVASAGISLYRGAEYYLNGGKGADVGIKAGLDATMSLIGAFGGPIGFGISAIYFIADYATDGFGGYGKIE